MLLNAPRLAGFLQTANVFSLFSLFIPATFVSNDTTGMLKTSKLKYESAPVLHRPMKEGGIYSLAPSVMVKNFGERRPSRIQKVASFFDFDWLNRSGDCYICKECRHIIWFYSDSDSLESEGQSRSIRNPFWK
jgi:hypothetical protein